MTEAKRMDPLIKAQWVAALRSGEYRQGTGVLRSQDDCYCCLGVLADLAAKAGVGEWRRDKSGDYLFDGAGFATLPSSVGRWCGVKDLGPDVRHGGIETSLVSMNDGDGCTFAEIADAIESQL